MLSRVHVDTRPRRRLATATLLAAACALACSSPTAGEPSGPYVNVWRRAALEERQSAAVSASTGVVHAVGHMATPYPCYGVNASAIRSVRVLIITLRARPSSDGGLAVASEWNYRLLCSTCRVRNGR